MCVGVCVQVWECVSVTGDLCWWLEVQQQVSACEGVGGSVGAKVGHRLICTVCLGLSVDYWSWIVSLYSCIPVSLSVSTCSCAFTLRQLFWGQAGVTQWYNSLNPHLLQVNGRKDHHPPILLLVLLFSNSMLYPQSFAILSGPSKDGITLCVRVDLGGWRYLSLWLQSCGRAEHAGRC